MKMYNFSTKSQHIQILGIRGIPANHSGFESFAEKFALYLKKKGWDVTVYCQEDGGFEVYEDEWQGINRVHIPVNLEGPNGTILFDWKSTWIALRKGFPVLTLGYNTAVFCLFYRLKGVKNVINMDGIEWQRGKWGLLERIWFYMNEKFGAWIANHLVADHPEIKKHLSGFVSSNKITVIPYTAEFLSTVDSQHLANFNIKGGRYVLLIARPEPENSILEIVETYSQKTRGIPLIVLGRYFPKSNTYHKKVIKSAGGEVKFVGGIYDKGIVNCLRFHCRFYIHGHTVGGTNPSLVEALGAGSAVLAKDNRFNRWVAGKGACYFMTLRECEQKITLLLQNDQLIRRMQNQSREQFVKNFTDSKVHEAYENLFLD